MRPPKTQAGDVYHRLTVIEFDHSDKHWQRHYRCRCECGNEVVVNGGALRNGHTKSCGCWHRDAVTLHGQSGTPTWRSWKAMKIRCLDPSFVHFAYYGGRGIQVCDPWLEFENFLADMGERPEGTTLDRTNPDGNYEPGNCTWATPIEQRQNRRDS